jgi:DNA polymerase III epsilon subunit-like protein
MQELKLILPIRCKGTIFDVETTGWTPSVGELITIGYVSGSKLRIIQRDDRDGSERNRIYEIAKSLTVLPRPYMAYNKSFDERWLGFEIDHDLWSR